MNYNNPYFNPYQQYPYTQQQYQLQQQVQTNYLPLTFINGIEGAKAFIVAPNQVVYLKDSDSNILYEKKADAQGRYTLTAFELKPIDVNNNSKNNQETIKNDYITKDDLIELKSSFFEELNIISRQLENLSKTKSAIANEV